MSVNINADTTNGLVLTSDTSGELKLQSAGADIATVNSSGITMAAGKVISNSGISSYTDSDALTLFNASGSAPVYACRAWASWDINQTILGSGNVSSITDNGVGRYTVNMTTAMPDVNYSITALGGDDSTSQIGIYTGNNTHTPLYTTSSFRIATSNYSGSFQDKDYNHIAVFR